MKSIVSVCKNGLSCACGDSWSYPNKFIYAFLEQTGLYFENEKSFDWSQKRRYDAYVKYDDKQIIIEMHGGQHYGKPISTNENARTPEEEKSNDKFKLELACANGIEYYFEIDSRKSNLDYIKNSIIESGLLSAIEISESDIDWVACDSFATSNVVKEICREFEEDGLSAYDLSEKYKKNVKMIQRYLRHGAKLGWCNYDGAVESAKNLGDKRKKQVYCKTVDMYFKNATAAAEYLNLPDAKNNGRSIRNSIKYNRPYLSYEFSYA